jgi:hypothetical protein
MGTSLTNLDHPSVTSRRDWPARNAGVRESVSHHVLGRRRTRTSCAADATVVAPKRGSKTAAAAELFRSRHCPIDSLIHWCKCHGDERSIDPQIVDHSATGW